MALGSLVASHTKLRLPPSTTVILSDNDTITGGPKDNNTIKYVCNIIVDD